MPRPPTQEGAGADGKQKHGRRLRDASGVNGEDQLDGCPDIRSWRGHIVSAQCDQAGVIQAQVDYWLTGSVFRCPP